MLWNSYTVHTYSFIYTPYGVVSSYPVWQSIMYGIAVCFTVILSRPIQCYIVLYIKPVSFLVCSFSTCRLTDCLLVLSPARKTPMGSYMCFIVMYMCWRHQCGLQETLVTGGGGRILAPLHRHGLLPAGRHYRSCPLAQSFWCRAH